MSEQQTIPGGIESFEAALDELTEIVARLESGGLTLNETLALYERGQALAAACGKMLDQADLRLEQLRESGGSFETTPLDDGT